MKMEEGAGWKEQRGSLEGEGAMKEVDVIKIYYACVWKCHDEICCVFLMHANNITNFESAFTKDLLPDLENWTAQPLVSRPAPARPAL